ncbi:ABC transporter ATP-binding protein [Paracraurococcus lichenis]|uniref:ABC transporter ATP-binding protein n=1 Tax=Paracraurococcus lichenis TaxID=3064888 RepID=A0ABT9E5L0_9PROT|nr:ABC transporter ATP-binding protein [Paracraurococcus sp. LOR1-02]MDO9711457.1 ABC transporter ATP-binding protein [Paracraurococcus sp. LOR1-02]
MTAPLLAVDDLVVDYRTPRGTLRAVDRVSLAVARGETLGLVGESGCGKSSLGRAIVQLVEPSAGAIRLDGTDIIRLPARTRHALRPRVQMIFQDPAGALDPRHRIGWSIAAPLRVGSSGGGPAARRARVAELMQLVDLRPELAERLPHELSGGQRQRVGIARALATRPDLIVCDEPVSALDLSLQAQVINLLRRLQRDQGIAYLFISHDIGVVEHVADRIAVMYLGQIVEVTSRQDLRQAAHPYTRALLAASPVIDPGRSRIGSKSVIGGDLPSPFAPPRGCRFHTRCSHAMPICRAQEPPLLATAPGQLAACFLHAANPATATAA